MVCNCQGASFPKIVGCEAGRLVGAELLVPCHPLRNARVISPLYRLCAQARYSGGRWGTTAIQRPNHLRPAGCSPPKDVVDAGARREWGWLRLSTTITITTTTTVKTMGQPPLENEILWQEVRER